MRPTYCLSSWGWGTRALLGKVAGGMPHGGGDGSLDEELVGMRMPFTEHLLRATVNPPNSPVSNKNMETRRDKVACLSPHSKWRCRDVNSSSWEKTLLSQSMQGTRLLSRKQQMAKENTTGWEGVRMTRSRGV